MMYSSRQGKALNRLNEEVAVKGFYESLLHVPPVAFVGLLLVFIFLSTGVLFILRERFEGIPYNLSWSSQHGDLLLVGIVVIAVAAVLRAGTGKLPFWVDEWWYITLVVIATIILTAGTICFLWRAQRGLEGVQVADAYHNMVIIPFFFALILLSLPPILFVGSWWEFGFACALGGGWGILLALDIIFKRLAQQKLLAVMIKAYAQRHDLRW